MKNLKPKRVAAACVIPSTSSKEKLLRKSASMPKPARFLRTPKKAPIRTEFQAGTVDYLQAFRVGRRQTENPRRSWKEIRSDQRANPTIAEYRLGEAA